MADFAKTCKKPSGQSPIRIEGDLAYVKLMNSELECVVSTSDLHLVQGDRWRLFSTASGHGYAVSHRSGLMHRILLGAQKGMVVDHANGDGLDNRRENIRLCSQTQNMANKVAERRNKLKAKGVYHRDDTFYACIHSQGRSIHLGSFRTKEEAAAAYRGAAKVLWGEYAAAP